MRRGTTARLALALAALPALPALSACHLVFPIDGQGGDDQLGDDAPSTDAQLCFGSSVFTVCLTAVPTNTVTLTAGFLTGVNENCTLVVDQGAGREVCVVVGREIVVAGETVVGGVRPLALLGYDRVRIDAALDLSSIGNRTGAGADGSCMDVLIDGRDGALGAGGGAGGSFGANGGGGGDQIGVQDAQGGTPPAPPTVDFLRAGCRGGHGGVKTGLGGRAAGGHAGGAVVILAGAEIHVTSNGLVNASGGGAAAGEITNGGGGGGGGGLIGLEAPRVIVDGHVFARGGSGGGGGGSTNTGTKGADPLDATSPTPGGPGAASGGGAGGAGCVVDSGSAGANGMYGGGGGGGGCGVVRLVGERSGSGPIVPPPS